jgi:hypothetical protein
MQDTIGHVLEVGRWALLLFAGGLILTWGAGIFEHFLSTVFRIENKYTETAISITVISSFVAACVGLIGLVACAIILATLRLVS